MFLVVAIEVEKRRSGKNGGKWSKMGCRGYLVGNGFPRVLRHSPTTFDGSDSTCRRSPLKTPSLVDNCDTELRVR